MKKLAVSTLVLLSLIIASCGSDKGSAEIIETNFIEEVPLRFNFEFQFDKSVAADTMLNIRIDEEMLVFSPPIVGSFNWSESNILQFSPSEKLKPATRYSVTIGSDYDKFGNGLQVDKSWSKEFHTPLLSVDEVEGYWGENKNNASVPGMYVNIQFNHPIQPNDLGGKLKVNVGGQDQTYVVEEKDPSRDVTLYLPQVQPEDKNIAFSVNLTKDLMPVEGNEGLKEDVNITRYLNSPFVIEIGGLKGEHDGLKGVIKVFTSQKVLDEGLNHLIDVEPSVDFDIEVEDQEIRLISSEFDSETMYSVSIEDGLKGVFGGELKTLYSSEVSFGDLNPSISFLDEKNLYLSRHGKRNIEINIVNVEEVTVEIFKVYENNIINFYNNRSDYYDDYYYDDYYDEYDSYSGDDNNVGTMGDLVWKDKIPTKNLKSKGANKILKLDFMDKLKDYDGLYQVVLSSNDNYWLSTKKIVSISDIGLIVKKGPRSIAVFANSIDAATPMADVEIKLIGMNNQHTLIKKTDATGVAIFDVDEDQAVNFETALVTAKTDKDYNFILLEKTMISTSRHEVGGYREVPSGYMTFMYPERDIYRPGEKINVSTIIRDYQWNAPKPFPVKVKLMSPNGKEVGNIRKTTNEDGGFEASFQLSPSSATGSYVAVVLSATDVVLQNLYIKVEEFVPDRIKVTTDLDKKSYENGESVDLSIQAMNLFGTPASNRNWESEMQISRAYFSVPNFDNYNFSINQNYTYFNSILESGETDGSGEASVYFNVPEEYENMGMLNARIYTTVFDETGRPVHQNNFAKIHTQDYYYGIEYNGYYYKTNQPITSKLIAVDTKMKPANGVPTEITLIRHEWKNVLAQSGSYYRYHSVPQEVILDEKVITLNQAGDQYVFTPDVSGEYELRISKPGVANYVSQHFYCYGWNSTNNSSFKVNNEGNIDMKMDKETYQVGETAKVLLTTPFSGRVLVTVESNKVIKHFYQETDKKSLEFPLKLTEEMLPNVYVTATLFRPHAVSDLPLTVAHGFAPVIVQDKNREIPVEIEAVATTRSKTKQMITIKGKPNSSVTVACVDEGILQVTGFKTPDPYHYFYQKRALMMNSYDMYPYLFPEVSLHSGRPGGGDGEGEMAKRLNPMKNKRFKLVSFWSGILQTDGSGEAQFEIDIPQFSGSLRIMAVDYQGNSFGSADKNMIVADPIILSAGIPRFLSPGDTLVMPLTITNTTKDNASASTTIELEGPLSLVPSGADDTSIQANSEGRRVFRIAVGQEIGEAKITAKVTAFGETFVHETDISVRPGSPLQKRSGSGTATNGKITRVEMNDDGFLEKTIGRKLLVSNSPLVKFTKDIEYLLRYPHGCIEQTVSKAFPQLYFDDIIKDMGIYKDRAGNARANVKFAISKLQRMQLYNGGYTYWQGGGYESYWGSVLATHFLVEAKKAGYSVNKEDLKLSLDYLKMKLQNKERVYYYYNGNMKREIIPKSAIYSVYILALANKPDRSAMNYYKANLSDLSLDSKYLLAGAYQLIGDEKSFHDILPNAFEGERSNNALGGSFYSYVRDEALALNILLETDPNNPQVLYMAKHVSEQLSKKRYLNTQERLFGFLAMGKLAKRNADNNVTGQIKVGGASVAQFSGKTLRLETDKLTDNHIEITVDGKGELYYFWETEGIDRNGNYIEEDKFLRVRKTFYNRNGSPIYNNHFKQNDLIIVKLTIESASNQNIENVAISDILPAGFEIENPRIDDLPEYNWIRDKSYPDYQDIRDDRINLYTNVDQYTRHFYYMVRAVSPGKYYMGPVGADAMYNGEYHSYSGAGWITIEE